MEDYEKKYEEALEKAKDLLHIKNTTNYGLDIDLLNYIFPELQESKDEKIRNALIKGVECCKASGWTNFGNNVDIDVVLDWLKKQGGKESDPRYENLEELLAADNIYQMSMNDAMVNEAKEKAAKALSKLCIGKLLGFENQGEQKPADKPISKDEILYQLVQNGTITEFDYLYLTRRFNITEPTKDYQDIDPHFGIPADKVKSNLLTVERAKEISPFMRSGFENESADKVEPKFKVGDMVCKKKDNSFCATINSITDTVYLCDVFDSDGDYDDDYAFLISEQDEYELVEKIEPQSAWSDEDEENLQHCCMAISADGLHTYEDKQEMEAWLKSLKDRVQPKQVCGVEDEKHILSIEQVLNCADLLNVVPEKINVLKDWLKSLKERLGGNL